MRTRSNHALGRRTTGASTFACVTLALLTAPHDASAQAVTLADAFRRAEAASEQIAIAEAGVLRAGGERRRATSQLLPQLWASAGYTHTFASEFDVVGFSGDGGGADGGGGDPAECGEFMPDTSLPFEQRVASLEGAVRCASTANPFASFTQLPFGRKNQYNLSLAVSQNVWAGGRLRAQVHAADAARVAAELQLVSARAQLAFDVAQAYYDAILADRLVEIAESSLAQAEATLADVRLAREVGRQPEFEVLRAQVSYDTQRPVVIRRTSDRDLAYLRLKQLLDLPADATIELATELEGEEPPAIEPMIADLLPPVEALPGEIEGLDTVRSRAPVRQAAQAVHVQQNLLAVARSQRWPSVSLSSQYGRIAYLDNGLVSWSDFRTNWLVSASVQVPVFTGGRIAGDEMIARADLAESEARFSLTVELAELDTRDAVERLEAARAAWVASAGTVEQAEKAYTIAQVRYEEGISTQLELNDSRLLLQQAGANRAVAARDLQIARLHVALLPYLPIGANRGTASGTAGAAAVEVDATRAAGGTAGQPATSGAAGAARGAATGLPGGVRANVQGGG